MKKLAFALCCLALPVQAQDVEDFVTANLLSVFYHELGHAVIDLMQLPVFGQEEDAADVASVLLIDMLYEEEAAVGIVYDAAFGFLADAEDTGEDVAWWGVHGPDLQRYYNLVCLFAGADIEEREDVASDLGLPEERLETCEEEFELANDSWGPVFEEMAEAAPSDTIRYTGDATGLAADLIREEVAALNEDFAFPSGLTVGVASCDEANAFYDPANAEIIICTELEDWLRDAAPG